MLNETFVELCYCATFQIGHITSLARPFVCPSIP